MSCTLCGDICTCSPRPVSRAAVAEAPDQLWPSTDAAWQDNTWRKEITSRVRAHKRRRGHDEDSFDLFEEPQSQIEEDSTAVEEALPPPPSRYQRIAMKRAQAQFESGNLIVFPQPEVDPIEEALAEPIPETPRILEAPLEPQLPESHGPLFAAIELEPLPSPVIQPDAGIEAELPLPVAPLSVQLTCYAIDTALAWAAFGLFAWISISNTGIEVGNKAVMASGVVLAGLFWMAYHCIFLHHAGATPGMNMTGVALCTFDDNVPCRATRGKRSAALCLSALSMGMGFCWSFVDEDTLGWHDRISRTYLRLL
jgi:hypothetical protein